MSNGFIVASLVITTASATSCVVLYAELLRARQSLAEYQSAYLAQTIKAEITDRMDEELRQLGVMR